MASARLMPIALTLMRTSFGPGAGTWASTNSRTSGPPAFANLIVRDMAASVELSAPGPRERMRLAGERLAQEIRRPARRRGGFDEFELGELFAERTQGRTDSRRCAHLTPPTSRHRPGAPG